MKVGIVGCGFIGTQLALAIQKRFGGSVRLIGISDSRPEQALRLSRRLHPPVPLLSLSEIVRRSQLVIEAASPQAVRELLPRVVAQRKALLVMSSGGLLGQRKLLERAVRNKIPLYVPSGAVAGLDGLKGAAAGQLRSVTLTTRKPPAAFLGAPGAARFQKKLKKLREPMVLFKGSADRAAAAFPQNINVAATLALAGIGPRRTKVRIIADPTVRSNLHEVEVVGSFGRFQVRIENRPSAENPKTSRLAVQSAIATLEKIFQSLQVGT